MSSLRFGILIGIVLAFATVMYGAAGFFTVIIFGAIGGIIAAHFGGEIDLRRAFDSVSQRGRG